MVTFNRKQIKELLESEGAHMKYSLGQNYLISSSGIGSYLGHLKPTESIIEIGPGIGNITINYFKDFKKVILIEIDTEKIPILKKNLIEFNGGIYPEWVEIINKDFFDISFEELVSPLGTYQLIGALPYNISKRIIRAHFDILPHPEQSIFIVQKEVADKYVEQVPNETFLSVSSKLYATVAKKEILKKQDFFPVPKIDSRILIFTNYKYTTIPELVTLNAISSFIKKGYSSPRKKLNNTLKEVRFLTVSTTLLEKRAQELGINDWIDLYNSAEEK